MKSLISAVFLLSVTSVVVAEGLVDGVSTIRQSVGIYTSYCGGDYWKDNLWKSERACLTDGRIHLVYAHDASGKESSWHLKRDGTEEVKFKPSDKSTLLDAVYEGAQISVGEHQAIVLCVEAALHRYLDKNHKRVEGKVPYSEAVCSSTDRIWANWYLPDNDAVPVAEYDAELNRYLTTGHREHIHIHHNDQYPTDKDVKYWATKIYTKGILRWYVRY